MDHASAGSAFPPGPLTWIAFKPSFVVSGSSHCLVPPRAGGMHLRTDILAPAAGKRATSVGWLVSASRRPRRRKRGETNQAAACPAGRGEGTAPSIDRSIHHYRRDLGGTFALRCDMPHALNALLKGTGWGSTRPLNLWERVGATSYPYTSDDG